MRPMMATADGTAKAGPMPWKALHTSKKMMDLDMAPSLLRGLTVTRQGLVDTSFVDDLYVTFHLALCTIQIR